MVKFYSPMNVKDINRKNTLKIVQWCHINYGYSKFNTTNITVKFVKGYCIDDINILGEYESETNTIFIYKKPHKSFIDFIRSVIHEFVHYLNDDEMYQKYLEVHHKSYYHHPHEIKAEAIANRDKRKCLKETFKT